MQQVVVEGWMSQGVSGNMARQLMSSATIAEDMAAIATARMQRMSANNGLHAALGSGGVQHCARGATLWQHATPRLCQFAWRAYDSVAKPHLLRLLLVLTLLLLFKVHVCSPLLLCFESFDLGPDICIVGAAV
jgi:hypothetical protein